MLTQNMLRTFEGKQDLSELIYNLHSNSNCSIVSCMFSDIEICISRIFRCLQSTSLKQIAEIDNQLRNQSLAEQSLGKLITE